jgi:subfamily B ATP-binding cassette protein MsbA
MVLTLRLMQYLKPYKKPMILGLLSMTVAALCTALLANQMEPIVDDVFMSKDATKLAIVSIQVFIIFALKGLSTYGQNVWMTHVGERIVADMRKQLISQVLKADLAYIHNTPTGELLSRFTTDVNMLHRVISRTITSFVRDGLTLILLISLMFYKDVLLAACAFFVFPLAIIPIIRIGKGMRKSSGSVQIEMAEFTVFLQQIIQGSRLIRSYAMQRFERERGHKLVDKIFKIVMKMTRIRCASHPIMEFLGGIAIVVVITYGGWQVIEGTQTAGAFFSFITALLLAYEPLKHIASLNAELQEKLAAAVRVFDIMDIKPTIATRKGSTMLANSKGDIIFEDVHFSYNTKKSALNGVDLIIPAGKTAALVGPSGSGKSTIMNLIPRFYDVNAGIITIGTQTIQDIKLNSLRSNIGLVSQEVTLFDDTVAGNIGYGKMGANQKAIEKAAKAAAAHDFILDLPEGYDTLVGEQGIKLSGGQRQRLAIARAMLKDAPILLLDEATSALDSESEQQIQQALKTLMAGRTTLIIAHRLSTIVEADVIYVVDNGKIIASGRHEELLKSSKMYAKLCKVQFGSA